MRPAAIEPPGAEVRGAVGLRVEEVGEPAGAGRTMPRRQSAGRGDPAVGGGLVVAGDDRRPLHPQPPTLGFDRRDAAGAKDDPGGQPRKDKRAPRIMTIFCWIDRRRGATVIFAVNLW